MLSLQTSRSFGMVSRHAPMLSFPGRNTSCVVTSLGLISRPFDFRASRNGSNPKTLTHIQIHHSGFIKMPQFLGRFSVSRFHVATMKIVWSMWKTAPKKSIYSRRNQWISSDIPVSTSCSDHHHPVTAWEGDPKRFMGRFFYPSNFGPHAYQIKGIPSTQGGNDTSLDSVHLKNSRLGALKNTQVVWQWYF